MEENRVNKVKEHIQKVAEIERKTIPIVNTCIAGIVTAADLVSASEVCIVHCFFNQDDLFAVVVQ
jgi:hypothetical protein